jgi:hypothetical protein
MKLRLFGVVALIACAAASMTAVQARADTHAPSSQHVTMMRDSGTYDVVSPADAAHGGQVTTSNAAILALNTTVTDAITGEILFQSKPTAVRNPQAQTWSFAIDGVVITIGAIVTHQADIPFIRERANAPAPDPTRLALAVRPQPSRSGA